MQLLCNGNVLCVSKLKSLTYLHARKTASRPTAAVCMCISCCGGAAGKLNSKVGRTRTASAA